MKALVVTNCATPAYTSGLRALFPKWEVKGANLDVAQKWLGTERNDAFCTFLRDSDMLLLGSENEAEFAEYASGKDVISIPYFYFRGFHPDSFHLGVGNRPLPSVLGTGNLHSRIVAAAFLLGLPQKSAVEGFHTATYDRIGYFSLFPSERQNLLERFGAKHIDLKQSFESWHASGNFLYTYNHAKAFVFNDILLEALSDRYLDVSQRQAAQRALAAVPDYLEPSIRWPVYPDIAARYGIESDFLWRTGVTAGPVSMTLEDFVARTFETLSTVPDLSAGCVPGFESCRDALLGSVPI